MPPNGIVLRYEDICVQERTKIKKEGSKNSDLTLIPLLAHVTGTLLPNQVTAIMGSNHKNVMLKVLSGYEINSDWTITGHMYVNGIPICDSLISVGIASYITKDCNVTTVFENFKRTTVLDLVKFHAQLASNHVIDNHSFGDMLPPNTNQHAMIRHVLSCANIPYADQTKVCVLLFFSFFFFVCVFLFCFGLFLVCVYMFIFVF